MCLHVGLTQICHHWRGATSGNAELEKAVMEKHNQLNVTEIFPSYCISASLLSRGCFKLKKEKKMTECYFFVYSYMAIEARSLLACRFLSVQLTSASSSLMPFTKSTASLAKQLRPPASKRLSTAPKSSRSRWSQRTT